MNNDHIKAYMQQIDNNIALLNKALLTMHNAIPLNEKSKVLIIGAILQLQTKIKKYNSDYMHLSNSHLINERETQKLLFSIKAFNKFAGNTIRVFKKAL